MSWQNKMIHIKILFKIVFYSTEYFSTYSLKTLKTLCFHNYLPDFYNNLTKYSNFHCIDEEIDLITGKWFPPYHGVSKQYNGIQSSGLQVFTLPFALNQYHSDII